MNNIFLDNKKSLLNRRKLRTGYKGSRTNHMKHNSMIQLIQKMNCNNIKEGSKLGTVI